MSACAVVIGLYSEFVVATEAGATSNEFDVISYVEVVRGFL